MRYCIPLYSGYTPYVDELITFIYTSINHKLHFGYTDATEAYQAFVWFDASGCLDSYQNISLLIPLYGHQKYYVENVVRHSSWKNYILFKHQFPF